MVCRTGVRLLPDQGQRSGEALLAQRLGGAQTGQRRADDDDPALADHEAPRPALLADQNGLYRTGRLRASDALMLIVGHARPEHQGLLAMQFEHLGARNTHCA